MRVYECIGWEACKTTSVMVANLVAIREARCAVNWNGDEVVAYNLRGTHECVQYRSTTGAVVHPEEGI